MQRQVGGAVPVAGRHEALELGPGCRHRRHRGPQSDQVLRALVTVARRGDDRDDFGGRLLFRLRDSGGDGLPIVGAEPLRGYHSPVAPPPPENPPPKEPPPNDESLLLELLLPESELGGGL